MDSNQIQKIEGLIKSSAILSPTERVEWQSLLNLMNERQLEELEKILASGIKPAQAATAPVEPQHQIPNLSHIVNLPKNFNGPLSSPQKSPQQIVTPESLAKSIIQAKSEMKPLPETIAKKSGFASKLKAIFNEKELPAGKNAEPLELEAPKAEVPQKSVIKNAEPLASAMPKIEPLKPTIKPPLKTILPPLLPVQSKPAPVTPLPPKPKVPDFVPQGSVQKTASALAGKTDVQKEILQNLKPDIKLPIKPPLLPRVPIKSAPAFIPGVNFPNLPAGATKDFQATALKKIENTPKPSLTPAIKPVLAPKKSLGPAPSFDSAESLAAFSVKTLEDCDLDQLVAKIKTLINKIGYFEAVFNIEKSSAYKLYIQTGLKLLSQQQDFEQMEAGNDNLTREQFEKFADLLAKIQSS